MVRKTLFPALAATAAVVAVLSVLSLTEPDGDEPVAEASKVQKVELRDEVNRLVWEVEAIEDEYEGRLIPHGQFALYFPRTGKLRGVGQFTYGLRSGVWRLYDEDGKQLGEAGYVVDFRGLKGAGFDPYAVCTLKWSRGYPIYETGTPWSIAGLVGAKSQEISGFDRGDPKSRPGPWLRSYLIAYSYHSRLLWEREKEKYLGYYENEDEGFKEPTWSEIIKGTVRHGQ